MKSPFRQELRPMMTGLIVVAIAAISFSFFLNRIDAFWGFMGRVLRILSPLVIGIVITFIVGPISNWIEAALRRVLIRSERRRRLRRGISLLTAYVATVALLVAFVAVTLPTLIDSVRILIDTAPGYISNLREEILFWLDENAIGDENLRNFFISWEPMLRWGVDYLNQQLPNITSVATNITNALVNFLLGFFISIYMLLSRERFSAQARKLLTAFMPGERVAHVTYWARRTHYVFSRFAGGTFLHSLIVGVLCYVFMAIFRMEYAILISVIVGVTNILPVFGPFIGGATGCVILLFVNPMSALWFGIMVLVLQQVDGNFLGPRILGDSIGLSPFWVIAALVLGGGFWGVPGMIISVPVFALIYAVIKTIVEARLARRGLPAATADYASGGGGGGKPPEAKES